MELLSAFLEPGDLYWCFGFGWMSLQGLRPYILLISITIIIISSNKALAC
jgi:hypothetical protein